jgi:hypothetical protein
LLSSWFGWQAGWLAGWLAGMLPRQAILVLSYLSEGSVEVFIIESITLPDNSIGCVSTVLVDAARVLVHWQVKVAIDAPVGVPRISN